MWLLTKGAHFSLVSARDSVMHWSIPISSQWTCLAAAILLYQVLKPVSLDDRDLKVCFHEGTLGLTCVNGILFVSALISQVGSGLPMGPKRNRCDLLLVGIRIWFLKTYGT